jgi:hypothetical protein
VVITAIQPGGDPGAFTFFLLRIPIAVFPFIVAGAIAGWIGGRIRARAIAAPR